MIKNRFKGKNVLVVGGSTGIGKKIVNAFLDEGASLVVADIDELKGYKMLEDCSGKLIKFYKLDVTNEDNIINLARDVMKVDVLVFCVRGPRQKKKEMELTFQESMESMQVILGGSYIISKHIIPLMKKQKGGVIINIGSISGMFVGLEGMFYHVAKAGLIQFTKYLAERFGSDNIRINCISPGFIVNDENRQYFESDENYSYRKDAINVHPLRKIGSSADVADAVLFLASNEASFITGQNLIVDGGLTIRDQWSVADQFRKKEP